MHWVPRCQQSVSGLSYPQTLLVYGLRVFAFLTLLWLTIVSDVVFLAALDVKDVTVVGFPNAHGTRVQAPITDAAYSYELIEVNLTSDLWHATTITWIRDALEAQGISPPDCHIRRR